MKLYEKRYFQKVNYGCPTLSQMHSDQPICMSPDSFDISTSLKYDAQTRNVIILEVWLFIAQKAFAWTARNWRIAILPGFL